MFELNTINKLYLELSQFATAKTAREESLEVKLAFANKQLERLEELTDLLTSAKAIAERQGADTHWQRWCDRLTAAGIGSVTPKVFKILPSDLE